MDATRRPQLPALSYLESDSIKRDEEAAYQLQKQPRNTVSSGAQQSLPHANANTAAPSPTYHYPPGPPPPYSLAHGAPPTNTWTGSNIKVSPPASRRTSEHEREMTKPRQSLPSLSEALGGVDNPAVFTSAAPPSSSIHSQLPTSFAPSPTSRRSYAMEPPSTTSSAYPTTAAPSQYPAFRPDLPRQSSYPSSESVRPPAPYSTAPESRSLHVQTPQPTPRPTQQQPVIYSRAPSPSSVHDPTPAHSANSAGNPTTFSYGYTPCPPRYAEPAPPVTSSSGPIYQPSAYNPPHSAQSSWKGDATRYEDRQPSITHHTENVKRHLEFVDFEAALNEISATSNILGDFSRRYGDRMHQTQRTGPTMSTLPGLVEVDDMVNKSRVAHESLLKIRDVILQQQVAYEADQRQQLKGYDHHSQQSVPHHSQMDVDDGKSNGFVGPDPKKRRGRAAPPGRCHSCNRAETPEWRRGPDGARTLCNACGLHYAKLTRKNNGGSKATNVGSSNLRPKETIGQ